MRALIISFCLLCGTVCFSQNTNTFLLGTETAGKYLHSYDRAADTSYTWAAFSWGPYLGYFITDSWAIGVTGEYDYLRIQGETTERYKGFGLFSKYITSLFPNRKSFLKAIHFAGEAAFLKTDNFFREGQIIPANNQSLLKLSAGVSFKVWKGFHIEMAFAPRIYIGEGFIIDGRLNFEYHFGKFKKK